MTLVQHVQRLDRQLTPSGYGVIAVMLVPAIGVANYLAGKDITLSVFYVLPIAIAAWFIGRSFALVIACLSVIAWIAADFVDGIHYDNIFLLLWNATIQLLLYVVVIVLIHRMQFLQEDLERRVEARTSDLTREILERKALERGMLVAAERERRSIGQDLHDGLCQQLTGTALAGQALAEKLAADGRNEAGETRRIVVFIEEAISLARKLAKGLNPVDLQAGGLMEALEEFAATTTDLFGIQCRFVCDLPVLVHSPTTALHLYRITQEAVSNAVKHSGASEIVVRLDRVETGIRLTVSDNGSGIPHARFIREGMGLRSMADRAKVIGAEFAIGRRWNGGTELTCTAPIAQGAVDG